MSVQKRRQLYVVLLAAGLGLYERLILEGLPRARRRVHAVVVLVVLLLGLGLLLRVLVRLLLAVFVRGAQGAHVIQLPLLSKRIVVLSIFIICF